MSSPAAPNVSGVEVPGASLRVKGAAGLFLENLMTNVSAGYAGG